MESEILTGRKINEAKKNTTNEAVEELLRSAQEQLNRDMSSNLSRKAPVEDRETLERRAREKEKRERLIREQEERIQKANKERLKKEQEEKAAKEKQQKKEQEKKALQEKLKKEQEEKALQEKLKKEQEAKALQEKLKKEQEEKALQEKLKKEQEEKALQEKLKKEQELRAAQEKAEKERFVKEQAEKERVGKELAAYDKNADTKNPKADNSNVSKADDQVIKVQGNTQRIDIQVVDQMAEKLEGEKKAANEMAATMAIDDDVFVETNVPTPLSRGGSKIGNIIGGFLEFVWTMFKLAVVVGIITTVVGFFLSREMLIRGRNGNLRCLENMSVSETVAGNVDEEKKEIKEWIRNVRYEKLTLESDDGYILIARKMIIKEGGDNWAVVLHGYNGNMEDVYGIAKKYASKGYNILVPDLRASGESEGSFIGMGWLDRLDVINWIDVIIDECPDADIVIHGVDMGADTALMLSGEPIKSNIKAIVSDSAYTSAWDVMNKEFKKRHENWPAFPMMEMVNPVAKIWGGYTLKEADAVKQVQKASVPILLIQGGNDTFVTTDMVNELNASVASSHKLVTIPSGTHGDSRYADPEMYYGEVFDFVDLYVD